MTVRQMTRHDLETVLSWAGQEGWNPGLEDVDAFYQSDPAGFWVNEVNGQLAAAVSVVNHTSDFAFLGLYICRPDLRGQGLGLQVWKAGMAYAGDRCIGLDGVPAQIENYQKSGFRLYHNNIRYSGTIAARRFDTIRLANEDDRPALLAMDQAYCGIERSSFATSWFSETESRKTLVLQGLDSEIIAFATVRSCQTGAKVGPLYAQTKQHTENLLHACADVAATQTLIVDIPEYAQDFINLMQELHFVPSFNTARMYTAEPPVGQSAPYAAIATLELG